MSLSGGGALWCSAMGVARRTVRHHPVGVKSYTRRDHPVIYVDVRLHIVGIRRTSREFPHKLQPATVLRRLCQPGEPARPRTGKEVISGTCHGNAPAPRPRRSRVANERPGGSTPPPPGRSICPQGHPPRVTAAPGRPWPPPAP